jgi:ribonuclease Z
MKWKVDCIRCIHTVPCIGFGFTEIRNKLKQEFVSLERKEIIELKKNSIAITEEIEYPLFCYLGDTNDLILKNKLLNKYKFIMIECTFLDPIHIEEAIADRHLHWSQLENYIIDHKETTFVIYHFSMRYTTEYIKNFFETKNIANVIPWIKD